MKTNMCVCVCACAFVCVRVHVCVCVCVVVWDPLCENPAKVIFSDWLFSTKNHPSDSKEHFVNT